MHLKRVQIDVHFMCIPRLVLICVSSCVCVYVWAVSRTHIDHVGSVHLTKVGGIVYR